MSELNARQNGIMRTWRQRLWSFTQREWLSVFGFCSLGIISATCIRVTLFDHAFRHYLIARYLPSVTFDASQTYAEYLASAFAVILLAVALFVPGLVLRGTRSWWAGVTSGLVLVSLGAGFIVFVVPFSSIRHRLAAVFGTVGAAFLIGFVLHMRGRIRAERTVHERDLKVPMSVRSLAGTQPTESDDPIQTWAEDALGRASLVDSVSIKLLVARSPVIVLSGAFGSGKTSTLNLLREHLGDKTITVSFSTWLPGSQETLTSYLLNDIANQCMKQFVVPGLRKSARRLATALGENVPLLKNYLALIPSATQKDDIEGLKSALTRLPKRVVVLLDEIDRMEKDELLTLLKVIRGVSTLPNLSFVCAGNRATIVETVMGEVSDKANAYFEKFFPVLIEVPDPNPAALRGAATARLVAALNGRDWFRSRIEEEAFREEIGGIWDYRIAPFCRNLRAIGLLANDLSVAAASLRREVDPVDLTLVELLRRFKPAIYELVAGNGSVLTGGESLTRGGRYLTEEAQKKAGVKLLSDIREAVPHPGELQDIYGILSELFPNFFELIEKPPALRPKRKTSQQESEKRISEPGIFPAYFRYELPEAMFSSVELRSIVEQMELAKDESARETVILDALNSMEKGSLKRDDLLRKLADIIVDSISLPTALALALALMTAADKLVYDTFPAFAEAGHVLRIVLKVARRLPQSERVRFLRDCILRATDDTMAFRIQSAVPRQKDEFDLGVSAAQLYPSFVQRMRERYGRMVDAAKVDLNYSDSWAFDYWGRDLNAAGIASDPEDRKIQHDFWLRYIGNSRARLADVFRRFFLPVAVYSEDPTQLIENRVAVSDLRRLYEELPEDDGLTERDRKSLETLQRFLNGDFKNGVNPLGEGLYQ
jgi:predicted KAP-like P-loop ATPase